MSKFIKNALTTTALSLGLCAGVAQADTYMATNWMAPSHILNEFAYVPYVADISAATDGAVEFEIYSSGSLVPAPTTLSAVGDGVAQLGIVAASYTPSELPLSGMINDMAFTARDAFATAFALTELGLTNQKLVEEYGKHNTVFLGGYSTPTYVMMCMKDVTDLAGLNGTKVRTAGTAQNEWIGSISGVPVAVPMTDAYSGLERGSIDCMLSDPTNLGKGYMFWEVVKSITTLEQGTSLGATYVYNKDFWAGLTPEQRRAILDATATGLARSQVNYAENVESGLAGAQERGITLNEPSEDLVAALADFRAKMVEGLPARTASERGIDDPSDVLAEYVALEEKWFNLLQDVDRSDTEAVAQLVRDELFSKIDENSYGLN
ncbi:C4-dicarboxylate TRAP transporter substrate-binding protein [Paracoccus xiamenensis]|uniref:C4-dicarboxylate TRAP transporter substrate-binding protein n=1 Tax=Paracoccus xiamenensis TaxID=2714901 RepID=UPI00140B9E14|nr:C4-dicarboxylate TRAP transporter substrate-binding protein [Paracoccus xiamenensis]NHF74450.1 C4-dicarboxylate ABC transporter substrate-binding protein [Paracoccus xiamenensis]